MRSIFKAVAAASVISLAASPAIASEGANTRVLEVSEATVLAGTLSAAISSVAVGSHQSAYEAAILSALPASVEASTLSLALSEVASEYASSPTIIAAINSVAVTQFGGGGGGGGLGGFGLGGLYGLGVLSAIAIVAVQDDDYP